MKVKTLYYERTFNLGNYESQKVGIEIEVVDGEKAADVIKKMKAFVEAQKGNTQL